MSVGIRGLAAAAATSVVILTCAFTAPVAVAAAAVPDPGTHPSAARLAAPVAWADAKSAPIRPGVNTVTDGGGTCTSNFVFTNGDRYFLGQAAHCAGTGAASETDGCTSGTMPLGTPVTIKAADGSDRRGSLVYSSWVAMQAAGERDADTCAFNDFALVAIDPADVPAVNPSLPFFGGPTGVDGDGLRLGEQVFGYGNSPLRLGISALSPKVGVAAGETGGGRGHEIYTVTPGVPGDSGSGYVNADGRAVGILSTLNLAPMPVSNGVADLAHALAYADTRGGLGTIALVPGTEAFTRSPLGVPATALAGPAGPALGEA